MCKKAKRQKFLSLLLETTQNESHYYYLLLPEAYLQEVLDFMSGRRSGVPNYENELLLNIIEAIKPSSHNGQKTIISQNNNGYYSGQRPPSDIKKLLVKLHS
jgi:hypothetical protein